MKPSKWIGERIEVYEKLHKDWDEFKTIKGHTFAIHAILNYLDEQWEKEQKNEAK